MGDGSMILPMNSRIGQLDMPFGAAVRIPTDAEKAPALRLIMHFAEVKRGPTAAPLRPPLFHAGGCHRAEILTMREQWLANVRMTVQDDI